MAFKEIISSQFEEWQAAGKCSEAITLNAAIGEKYFDESSPCFFYGDINADLVMVNYNPQRNINLWGSNCEFNNFEDYLDYYAHFGERTYGINSKNIHKSSFDLKQIRFFKPFGILPFTDDKFHNLEVVIDKKLQIELVPFGSPKFDFNKIGIKNLESFVNGVFDLISSKERKYVIFCGKGFTEILKPFITNQMPQHFKLRKKDGTDTIDYFEAINIRLLFNGKEFTATIAPQYPEYGCPVERYGEKINELYGVF